MRILIVGASGRVGSLLVPMWDGEHEVVPADVRPMDHPRFVALDVCELDAVRAAMAGVDCVVHLSIARSEDLGHGTAEYANGSFDVHVKGVYNALRAAHEAGGKRVLYASSVSCVSHYPPHELVTSDHRPDGGGVYGITKGFGEELCRIFHRDSRLPVVVLRLGHVYIEAHGGKRGPVADHVLVHGSDVAGAFDTVLKSPFPPYAVIHVVGDAVPRRWDLETGARLYGWRPKVRFLPGGTPDPDTLPG